MSDMISALARKKGLGVKEAAARAATDTELLSLVLRNTRSKNDTLRYNCYQILLHVSVETPASLYPQWDFLVEMLDSTNNFFKFQAIYLIANLLSADTENRFGRISEKYLGLIDDQSVMIASHLALNAGKIAKAKPNLTADIQQRLLDAGGKSRLRKGGELLQSYIIEAFDLFFDEAAAKEEILGFVKDRLGSASPKTRKTCKEFLAKHERPRA
jgi:hypothetical protein